MKWSALMMGLVVVMSGVAGAQEEPPPPAPARPKCKTIQNLEAKRHQELVMLGTSLTARGAWVWQVTDALTQRYYGGLVTVTNAGIGSASSATGVNGNMERRVLSRNPDTVFIEFGINDAYEPFHISVETCRSRLENMIDVILKHNPDCEIILLTTNAVAGKPAEVRPHLEDYYQVYRDVAKERSLLLVDMYPLWQKLLQDDRATYDRYVRDGLHPGALGCEKVITPAILDAMGF